MNRFESGPVETTQKDKVDRYYEITEFHKGPAWEALPQNDQDAIDNMLSILKSNHDDAVFDRHQDEFKAYQKAVDKLGDITDKMVYELGIYDKELNERLFKNNAEIRKFNAEAAGSQLLREAAAEAGITVEEYIAKRREEDMAKAEKIKENL